LQEENNRRRIEINNLKRQNTTIENLELEVENLRGNISKRNGEISDLKNMLF
jgi:predicted RNase H-like nuclease (RuvC/YqgF family)